MMTDYKLDKRDFVLISYCSFFILCSIRCLALCLGYSRHLVNICGMNPMKVIKKINSILRRDVIIIVSLYCTSSSFSESCKSNIMH